ncbi:MAG: DinB family protein [Gemmatimonadales bacterium]|jgi:uncharacterized damage-inducible protein DinB
MKHLARLAGHLRWADERAQAALRRVGGGPSKALDLYAHLVASEHVWLARLTGVPPRMPVWPALTIEDCAELAAENHREYAEYLLRIESADLDRGMAYTNSAGQLFTSTVEDILLHVCLHGTYHRGQIALLLRQGGDAPEPTDYIAYIRGAPAATGGPRAGGA